MTTYIERLARSVDRCCKDHEVLPKPRIVRRENEAEITDAVEELRFQEYVRIYGGEK